MPVIHAVHTKDAFDIKRSRTNGNYVSILENPKASDAMIVATEKQKRDIVARYGHGNIHAIPHPYEATGQPTRFEDRQRYNVVYLARYSAEKNQAIAIRAFAQVIRVVPQAKLQLYGHGSGKGALQEQVKQLGLKQSISINDFVQDVAAVYESAGLSILTSQGEGFSLVVLESLCHGCPVVAFDVNYGPAEMIEDGENGAFVPFGNEDLLAQRIIEILGDPDHHQRLCEHTRRSAKRFQAKAVAEKWKSLIQDVLQPSAKPRMALNIGQRLQMAHAAWKQIDRGRNVRIWFDEDDNTLALSFAEGYREALTTEQSQALEAACRLLNLHVKESPPTIDLSALRSDLQKATTSRDGSGVSETFGRYYSQNKWGNSETVSGGGSTLAQTQTLRAVLPTLFSDLSVGSLLDLPCGDFHWMRHVPLDDGVQYLGADVVEALVQRNQDQFGSERVNFIRLDLLCDRIPRVDLILCRDCLVHLPTVDVRSALVNLCRSGSQWLLTTTFPGHQSAKDIAMGKWRPLNLEAEPFCLPPPLTFVVERCTQGHGRFADKSLGLWHLRDVANALGH